MSQSTTGVKYDGEKPDMSLLSSVAIFKVAEIMTFGKKKYSANNWRGGITYSRLLAAALRHIFLYLGGESKDPETGKSHLAHAMCCLMMILEFEDTRPDLDDRFIIKKAETEAFVEDVESAAKELLASKEMPFAIGDSVRLEHGTEVFTVAGYFYDQKLNQVMFVQDSNGRIYQADPVLYVAWTGEQASG